MDFEKKQIIDALYLALAESFEGMAFLEFDHWEEIDEAKESDDKQYIASVDITAPFGAKLNLVCSEQFILNIIESITGEEAPGDQSTISDTFKEILNTFAGRFLVKLLPENAEFDFGIPDAQLINYETVQNKESDIILKFDYGDESVLCIYNSN